MLLRVIKMNTFQDDLSNTLAKETSLVPDVQPLSLQTLFKHLCTVLFSPIGVLCAVSSHPEKEIAQLRNKVFV